MVSLKVKNSPQRLIFLVRHGELDIPPAKYFIGQVDFPLSEKGMKQGLQLQQHLSCIPLNGIFCSDLQRSLHTAQLIAQKHRAEISLVPELREINLGEWEGKLFEEIRRTYPNEFKARGEDIVHYRPPGGESFYDLHQRVIASFNEIVASTKGNILIVGHAGVNRMILCHLMGMPLENLFIISQDYGCLNVILQGNFGFRIRLLNKTFTIVPK